LYFNAVLGMAQQMTTAQHVLEETKKDFNRPTKSIHQSDDFCGNIREIGHNT